MYLWVIRSNRRQHLYLQRHRPDRAAGILDDDPTFLCGSDLVAWVTAANRENLQ